MVLIGISVLCPDGLDWDPAALDEDLEKQNFYTFSIKPL